MDRIEASDDSIMPVRVRGDIAGSPRSTGFIYRGLMDIIETKSIQGNSAIANIIDSNVGIVYSSRTSDEFVRPVHDVHQTVGKDDILTIDVGQLWTVLNAVGFYEQHGYERVEGVTIQTTNGVKMDSIWMEKP